jgi:dethiobiotin synthetase
LKLVVVAGTGTEVGKTWVSCELARHLQRLGRRVAARKLAQSFGPEERGRTDAELLAIATGERAADVCPPHRWYSRPMAPPMAAESMGLPVFRLADLLAELHWPLSADIGLVEQAGGLGSPQAADADGVEVVRALRPRTVVLVSRPGLGALGSVRLATMALVGQPTIVYLNRFEPGHELHERNRCWLADRQGLAVVTALADLSRLVAEA